MRPIELRQPPPRHGPRWPLLGLIAAVIVLMVAAWFAFGDAISGGGSDKPLQFSEAIVGAPSRVNPLFAYLNDTDRDMVSLVFSGLTRLSQDGTVIPDLAESWDVSSDGRTVTFHLRQGVTFHTGTPFSSADAVFTYNLLGDPALQGDPDQAPLWRQVHCSDPDAVTVVCELPAPFAPFLAYASIGILPGTILEGATAGSIFDNLFNQTPVGTGPYRLAQLVESRAVMKAHPAYHLGVPAIEEIELQFFSDSAGAAAAVVRGDADAILVDSATGEAERDEISGTSGLRTFSANRTAYTALYMNGSEAPLNDDAVRNAIAQAIDIESITGDILGTLAARATTPMVPGTWAFNPDVAPYEHDDDDARDRLEEAGWVLTEASDVRVKNDVPLEITLFADRDPVRDALAERVAEDLRDVGIGVTIELKDSSTLITDSLIPRDYQAAIFGWDQGLDPDPYPAWHSSQAGGNGRNLAEYQSEDADALMEDGRRTFDLDQRQSLYYSFQAVFNLDVPSVILYYPVYNYFVRETVEGVDLGTLFYTGSRFRNIHEWTLDSPAQVVVD